MNHVVVLENTIVVLTVMEFAPDTLGDCNGLLEWWTIGYLCLKM